MKTELLLVLFLLLLCPRYAAAQRDESRPEITAGRCYLTLVMHDTNNLTADDMSLDRAFQTNSQLQSLVKQTVYHRWYNDSPEIRDTKWSTYFGKRRPCIIIQAPADGFGRAKVIFATNNPLVWKTPENLISAVVASLIEFRLKHDQEFPLCWEWEPMEQLFPNLFPRGPNGPRPRRRPKPNPNDDDNPIKIPKPNKITPIFPEIKVSTPSVPVVVESPKNKKPTAETPNEGIPLLVFLLPILGFGVGAYVGSKRAK